LVDGRIAFGGHLFVGAASAVVRHGASTSYTAVRSAAVRGRLPRRRLHPLRHPRFHLDNHLPLLEALHVDGGGASGCQSISVSRSTWNGSRTLPRLFCIRDAVGRFKLAAGSSTPRHHRSILRYSAVSRRHRSRAART
jgi:hypothetical protein